jgi:alanyl-tRNA synthetase
MTSAEIRRSFLDFFREKEHTIVPSSSLLPDSPNLLFTNAGMNQFVPIFLGQTPCPYKPARAADTQKCIRAGGKHNDLEDVGFDTYHHTFFEMLGNWSFGDYFKREAIAWAWELVAGRWNFPASRIYATVFCPYLGKEGWQGRWERDFHHAEQYAEMSRHSDVSSIMVIVKPDGSEVRASAQDAMRVMLEERADIEAMAFWITQFKSSGLDPAIHIVPGNKKDNFWMMGDTGPCGPCSEMHVDLTPGPRDLDEARQRAGRELVNKGDARCIEIWNLVFIQFNANPDGSFVDLPAKHVDTGMGFERVTSMIQGTKGLQDFSEKVKISNYETDVFRPIFDELEKLTGLKYGSTLPASAQNLNEQEKIDVAFRVIADHIRTLSFSIADGIRPSNEGRGYVLRRILRRAVRYGRNLGLREPFLAKLVPVLGATMGEIFPEVVSQAATVQITLTQEETGFLRTLEDGVWEFEHRVESMFEIHEGVDKAIGDKASIGEISADFAFYLFDTCGFPLDLTELMARERGLTVDVAGFNRLMEEQKARSRAAQKKSVIELSDVYPETEFIGYGTTSANAVLLTLNNSPSETSLVLDRTTFYAEMGGQVGDTGIIRKDDTTYEIVNTVRKGGTTFHSLGRRIFTQNIFTPNSGVPVVIEVDGPRRHRIEGHHSGTHVLHWALKKVLGPTIGQKGSYVGPDGLRFDFSHGAAMTPAQVAEVEALVNERIAADVPVTWNERPYAEVKGDPSILQFFGDKYGDTVRVVTIGDFSRELCGGTHVKHSAQIGYFKILSEGAIAAGIRRIEAASGVALAERLRERAAKQDEAFAALKARKGDLAALTAIPADAAPEVLAELVEQREDALKAANAAVAQHEKEHAKAAEADFQRRASAEAAELIAAAREVNGIPFIAHQVAEGPAAYLPVLADALKSRWQGVALLAATEPGKVALLCGVAPAFSKKIQAGKIIQAIAPLVGGKGGGRPELAQGGGTNPEGLAAALAKAEELVAAAAA